MSFIDKPQITNYTEATHTHADTASGGTISHTNLTDKGTNTHAEIDTALTRLANTSGTNTGDQDLSGYLTSATAATTYLKLDSSNDPVTGDLTLSDTLSFGTKTAGIFSNFHLNTVATTDLPTGVFNVRANITNTANDVYVLDFLPTASIASTKYLMGARIYPQTLTTTGGAANFRAINILEAATLSGTLTENTGIRIGNFTKGTNNYAIYTNSGSVRFGDVVTIEPSSPTDGTDLMKFTTERAWTLQQGGTGSSATLQFFSDTAGKNLQIHPNSTSAGGLIIGDSIPASPERLSVVGSGNIKSQTESTLSTGYAFNRLRNDAPLNFDFGLYGSAHGSTLYGISTNNLAAVSTGAGNLLLGTAVANNLYLGTNGTVRVTIDSNGLQNHTMTSTTTSGTAIAVGITNTLAPATTTTAEYRALTFINGIGSSSADTTAFSGAGVYAGFFQNRSRTTGTINLVSGVYINGATLDSFSGNSTITSVYGALIYGTGRPSGTATLTSTSIVGAYVSPNTVGTGVTATNLYGIQVATPAAGTFTTGIGISVDAQTRAGTTNVGIRISEPSGASNNYALQLIGTGGTSASGITFGTDTNLYRSADNTLKTDDSFIITGDLTISAADIITDTTTGTKIGTDATQKLGFWNATPVVQSTGWSTSNVTTDKVLNANSTSIDELADVLGTLIDTLKNYGIIGA